MFQHLALNFANNFTQEVLMLVKDITTFLESNYINAMPYISCSIRLLECYLKCSLRTQKIESFDTL